METSVSFCTCRNRGCPLHPTRHAQGCTPCIAKNLRLGEIPNCFFQLLENSVERTGDTLEDFAALMEKSRRPHVEDREVMRNELGG